MKNLKKHILLTISIAVLLLSFSFVALQVEAGQNWFCTNEFYPDKSSCETQINNTNTLTFCSDKDVTQNNCSSSSRSTCILCGSGLICEAKTSTSASCVVACGSKTKSACENGCTWIDEGPPFFNQYCTSSRSLTPSPTPTPTQYKISGVVFYDDDPKGREGQWDMSTEKLYQSYQQGKQLLQVQFKNTKTGNIDYAAVDEYGSYTMSFTTNNLVGVSLVSTPKDCSVPTIGNAVPGTDSIVNIGLICTKPTPTPPAQYKISGAVFYDKYPYNGQWDLGKEKSYNGDKGLLQVQFSGADKTDLAGVDNQTGFYTMSFTTNKLVGVSLVSTPEGCAVPAINSIIPESDKKVNIGLQCRLKWASIAVCPTPTPTPIPAQDKGAKREPTPTPTGTPTPTNTPVPPTPTLTNAPTPTPKKFVSGTYECFTICYKDKTCTEKDSSGTVSCRQYNSNPEITCGNGNTCANETTTNCQPCELPSAPQEPRGGGPAPTKTPTPKPLPTSTPTPTLPPGVTPSATPTLPPGVTPTATPTPAPGEPTATPTPPPVCPDKSQGNTNPGDSPGEDCAIDILDRQIWIDEFIIEQFQGGDSAKKADFNNSGKVDLVDYTIWFTSYKMSFQR